MHCNWNSAVNKYMKKQIEEVSKLLCVWNSDASSIIAFQSRPVCEHLPTRPSIHSAFSLTEAERTRQVHLLRRIYVFLNGTTPSVSELFIDRFQGTTEALLLFLSVEENLKAKGQKNINLILEMRQQAYRRLNDLIRNKKWIVS